MVWIIHIVKFAMDHTQLDKTNFCKEVAVDVNIQKIALNYFSNIRCGQSIIVGTSVGY